MWTCADTISQFNVLVKGQEEEINRLKVSIVSDVDSCLAYLLVCHSIMMFLSLQV